MEKETTYPGLLTTKQSWIWGAINMLSVGMWILIEKIENGKIFIKSGAENTVCGYLSFMDGHVSIVSNEYPTGKIFF